MAFKLKNLFIRQVALVDRGANPEAHIVLAKRDTTTSGSGADIVDVTKQDYQCPQCGKVFSSQQEMDQHMANDHADAQKALADTTAELEAVKKELEALRGGDPHVEPFKSKYEEVTKELEESRRVMKEQLEAATKELEESRNEVRKIQSQRRREKFIKRAQELQYLPGAPADDFAEVLDHMESNALTPAQFEKVNRLLTAWNKLAKESKLFTEIGRDIPNFNGPEGSLVALAKAKMAADSKLTYEKAFAQAMEENPQLYRDYVKEQEEK